MNKLERLLEEALATASFNVHELNRHFVAADIRALHQQGALQQYIGVSAVVPDLLKVRLADEIRLRLRSYVHPETDRVGNGLTYALGGMLNPPLEGFVQNVVCAAAALGPGQVAQLLSDWSDGTPALYQRRAVLVGATVEGSIKLPEEGIEIDGMPTSMDELTSAVPPTLKYFVSSMGSDSVLGKPVLSVACSFGPIFYMPDGDVGAKARGEWAHGRLPEFSIEAFCEALSLASNGCVQPKHEWSHAPDLALFVTAAGGSMSRTDVSDTIGGVTLTQRHLEEARKLFLMRNGLSENTRRSLNVSIHRWIKSKGASSTPNRLIELRIALEALYLKDAGGEMSYRIATRGAWLLGVCGEERKTIFSALRGAYDLASKVVHARKIKESQEEQDKILEDGQSACRRGILKVMRQGEPNWDELVMDMN